MVLESDTPAARPTLWRHADFLRLWVGQTISNFGSQVGGGALSLTAILLLNATPVQLGLLMAASLAPTLVFGLFAGVWVDRLRRRPLLVAADLGRALLLLAVPVAFAFGMLRMELILLIAAAVGVLTTLFDISYHAFLPHVVGREQLVEGNSKLGISDSLAEITGPPLGGLLVQMVGAPFVAIVDAVSFLLSAFAISSTRAPERIETHARRENAFAEIIAGLRTIAETPVLLALLLATVTRDLGGGMFGALYNVYLIRELGMSPAFVGVTVGLGGISALGGAIVTERLVARCGERRTLIAGMLLTSMNVLIPLANGPSAPAMLLLAQSGDIAFAVVMITALSMRQKITPDQMMGRVHAGFTVLATLAVLVGGLVGGALAQSIGVRGTLWVAVSLVAGSVVWVWRMRE